MNAIKKIQLFALTFTLASVTNSTLAAPGQISNTPLFIGKNVKSNILFLLDDSGSMETETLLTQDALAINNYKNHRQYDNIIPLPHDNDGFKLQMCHGYNSLAYNPNVTYEPWPSVDSNGNTYQDQPITAARSHVFGRKEYDARDTSTVNLLSNNIGYTRWDDDNQNGIFDLGECGETNTHPILYGITIDRDHFVPTTSMTQSEQQNFANWYSYYRKRRFVLNSPMLEILNNIDMRVGLSTINRDRNVAQEIVDIAEGNNREKVIQRFQDIASGRGTPLRRPLENAGRYFSGDPVDRYFVSNSTQPDSPILSPEEGGACQQNFTMMITDGYSNENINNLPSLNIGNADGDNNSAFDGGVYGDQYSNTLGDIAMYYYENDLKPDDTLYPDIVQSKLNKDTNNAQHMLTYAIAFGVTGNLPGFPTGDTANWPTVSPFNSLWQGEKRQSLDDLMHAAFNGRGEYLSALNPNDLKEKLNSAIETIVSASQGSAAAASFNTTNISNGTLIYQSRFYPEYWNGTIEAYDFSGGGTQVCPVDNNLSCPKVVGDNTSCPTNCEGAKKVFNTGELLRQRVTNLGHKDREIITFNGKQGIPFYFPENPQNLTQTDLSSDQVDDLTYGQTNPSNITTYGKQITEFIRGDNRLSDGITFRDKDAHVLGDIVHSSAQMVGKPNAIYPNHIEGSDKPYKAFYSKFKNRKPLIYVGANDGMLHAFDAKTGEEHFAYIPGLVFSSESNKGLHWLANPNYSHRPYVDATPTIGDVFINNEWRTYLVGTLGAGGSGLYVLDITNPEQLNENNANNIVKFEFDHKDLGYGFSRPQIAKLNNGKWAAILGNGYGNEKNDGKAKLLIFYLDGSGHKIITTQAGKIANAKCNDPLSDCNGLSSPTLLDLTGDAKLDRVYAGDLHGNMWAFDLSSEEDKDWKVVHQDEFKQPTPLFKACTSSPCKPSARQPITTAPSVVAHPNIHNTKTSPNTLVLFGTGQYLTKEDIKSTSTQSFYAIWDAGNPEISIERTQLTRQDISVKSGKRTLSSRTVKYVDGQLGNYGWFIDLPKAGERSVINPIVVGKTVLFTTSIPNSTACSAGGSGYLMSADITAGTAPEVPAFSEGEAEPITAGVELISLPVGTTYIDYRSVVSNSRGDITTIDTNVIRPSKSRRVGWSIIK